MSDVLFYFCLTLFIIVCVLLILLVLIQKARGGGLSGAFGGAGGHTAFGAKTGDVLTLVTSGAFVVFIGLAVAMNLIVNYQHNHATTALAPSALPFLPT